MKGSKKFGVQSSEFGVKSKIKSLLFISLIACSLSLTADVYAGAGSTSCDFLTIGIGARAIGMGGAFSGLADDISAGYWNPGGMVQINNMEVLTMYNAWLGGMSHIYLGLGKKTAGGSAFGLQVNTVSSGDIPKSNLAGEDDGTFSASWMALGLTYAGYVGETTSIGMSLKNVTEIIAGESGAGMAADLGLLSSLSEKTKVGLVVQNAGTGLKYAGDDTTYPFPMVIRAGVGYTVTNEAEKGLVICADLSKGTTDKGIGLGAGGEYRTGKIALRLGAEMQGDGSMVPSFGVGLNAGSFLVDVGGGMYQDLGSAYKVSLIGRFGGSGGAVSVGREKKKETKVKSASAGGGALEKQLNQAIAAEDYAKAKEIKEKIAQKQQLEAEMNQAVAAEDYAKAKEIKAKISELEK